MSPHSTHRDEPVELHGPGVSIDDVVAVGRDRRPVTLTAAAVERMEASRRVVETLVDGTPTYGLSTGFGALATTTIPPERRQQLQKSLIRSHAAGMGDPVDDEVVRAMMFLRARTLSLGYSGIRPHVTAAIVDLLNSGAVPFVPRYGSLGASGDLAPLAHVAIVLLGEGTAYVDGELVDGATALGAAGVDPIEPAEKEGLALTNGTDGILGMVCLAIHDAARLLDQADMVAAHTVEALMATDRAFAADLQALRPHPGQATSAANLRAWLADSPILASHAGGDDPRVQDAYSIRCTPQVHGAARDTLDHARTVAERELASAIDNPMVLPDGRVESCGNFHGAPLGYIADFLAIALTDVGTISERRLDRILDRTRSYGLPPFLADDPGVDSGMMIGQYTAAAMCNANTTLSQPASVGSAPTSAMQEDHVSMAWNAAVKLRTVVDNLRRILAIEWCTAARGIDLRAPLQPAPAIAAVMAELRQVVPGPGPDAYLAPQLDAADALLKTSMLAVRPPT